LLAIVLLAAFIFMSYALHESPIGHIIVYGLLFAFFVQRGARASAVAQTARQQVASAAAHQAS